MKNCLKSIKNLKMNINQRLYDTRLKMITSDIYADPFYFLKNIDLIRARKTMYPMYKIFYLKKKKNF